MSLNALRCPQCYRVGSIGIEPAGEPDRVVVECSSCGYWNGMSKRTVAAWFPDAADTATAVA